MINESALVTREHLRAQLIPLIGREQEVLAVGELLLRPEVRLVTLTGIGGIGKTRLGLQVARSLEQEFADGVYFVPLSSLHDPDLVIPTLAQALGLKEAGDWSLEERLQTYLHEKRLLLLLDNFEQVAPAAFKLPLLVAACPQVKILITSRVVLHMRGEHEFPVLPLLLPDEQHPETVETLSHYSAIALFLQQARAVQPDFQLTVENARAITEICVRLDGLPLALELAAARVKLLPPRTLLARLKHRFEILISPSQDLPPRQRTLRNTLAWSYHLLTQEEQRLFRQLSVFTGNFTLEAAEALSNAAPSQELSVLDGLASLLDNSLLNQVERGAGEARFMMLETVREYGLECLEACGEIIATRRVHALYYVALAEQAEPYLSSGEQCIWLQQLEQAYPNLRMALAWFIEQAEAEMALRLSWALWRFWWVRGRVLEGRNWLEQALALSQEHENATLWIRARAVSALGILIGMQGHLDQAEDLCQESL
ncbi:MAG: hypothetical protein J2P37_20910, partial [Ktedonobacteraceae bacterium]|nr:hypothetical protein [Ktedonobacteraceae bacterium]